jgi:hypothetical protein
MTAVLREDPPDFPTERPISRGLERLVRRCLEKRPEDRLQSARDLAIALEAVSLGESSTVQAPLAGPTPRTLRPMAVAAAVAAVLLAAACIGWRRTAPSAADTVPRFTKLTRRAAWFPPRDLPRWPVRGLQRQLDRSPRVYTTEPDSVASTAALLEAHLLGVSRPMSWR